MNRANSRFTAWRLLAWNHPIVEIEVECTKGTYIRVLGEDIGRELGLPAHLGALRRTWVAPFQTAKLITLDELTDRGDQGYPDDCLLPVDAGLRAWPAVRLEAADAIRFSNGNPVAHDAAERWLGAGVR